MAGQNYDRLTIEQFGKHLLDSNDLDPIYVGLRFAEYSPEQRARWAIAYWCYYHAGVASYLSEFEGKDFWEWMSVAAANTRTSPAGGRWPRGSERRHFRGQTSAKGVEFLRTTYGDRPEAMLERIAEAAPEGYAAVAKRVREHYGFGDWISFKVADMLDRIFDVDIDFSQAAVFMFKDPVKATVMLWRDRQGLPANAEPKSKAILDDIITQTVSMLEEVFDGYDAPPHFNRPVGLQEVETVLCKWKSHMNGHYPLFNDIDEIRHGLAPWAEINDSAKEFLNAMPSREDNKWPAL